MDHARGGLAAQAEVLLRLLSAAVNAVRLYPPSSPLRADAITRFTQAARDITAVHGPVQYHIDRERFIMAETSVGEGLPQIAALAETLRALQVGQLIVAPGIGADEVARFVDVISGDATTLRGSGGLRTALLESGIANIAVVEVSLRARSEQGLLGLDLTTSPTEDIARELQLAVSQWNGDADGSGGDIIAEAVGRMEPAAQDLAMRRCAEALLLIDEPTRLEMLSSALPTTPSSPGMEGLLGVIAHMPPAALARLLRLTAGSRNGEPDSLLGAIEFPPELAAELAAMLRPSPQSEEQRGVPPEADVVGIVREVAESDEEDLAHIDLLVKDSTPRLAAARGLATTLQMARDRTSEESIRAIAEAMVPAVRQGALEQVAQAADFLKGLADDPSLAAAIQSARHALHEPALLKLCARQLADGASPEAPRTLLQAAGGPGADALMAAYLASDEPQRSRVLPTVVSMLESIAPVAGRALRTGDASAALATLHLLESIGSRRLVPTIAVGLEHLDIKVREAALSALAGVPGTESTQVLQKALAHWDPETRRIAAREIGGGGNEECVPALLKIVAEVSLFERNYELKKEVLKSLELLHSAKAVPVLKRLANGRMIGKKNRELRYLARRVLESLE